MHRLPSLCLCFLCSSELLQLPQECTIYRTCFQNFLCIIKSFQSALFIVSSLKIVLQFQMPSEAPFTVLVFICFDAVPNCCTYRQNEPLPSLFTKFICNSKSLYTYTLYINDEAEIVNKHVKNNSDDKESGRHW